MTDRHFDKSKALLEQARAVTPVGAQTYSKSWRYYSGQAAPYFLDRGDRGHVWDVDGNEFVDFVLSLGGVTVGYNQPEVNAAVEDQLKKGISFTQATELEVRLAEKLIEIIPCAEMVRFLKNGSDAASVCVRLARAFTGREMVAACGYHGMDDWYIGSTENYRGVPRGDRDLIRRFSYNDIGSLEDIFRQFPGQVAAVILEPLQGNGPVDGFLEKVRALTKKQGALLVFDEVVSGFRVALGGAQEFYGVTPDLSAFGKGMANGLPLSAAVGPRDVLRMVEENVFVSSTFGGEALSLAGALKTIEILSRPGSFPAVKKQAGRFREVLVRLAGTGTLHAAVQVVGEASHCGVVFSSGGKVSAQELFSVYQQALLRKGVLSVGINNFCLAHTDRDIDLHLEAAQEALRLVEQCIRKDSAEGLVSLPLIDPIFKRH